MTDNAWINTATGRRFNFFAVTPEDIDLVDIAVSLANQCRYAGHTRRHYSVAWHSIIVSRAVAACLPDDLDAQRWGLMHDAAEAYVTDVPWPIKAAGLVDGLSALEKRIASVIAERFGLSPVEPAIVKEIDLEILDLEASHLLRRHPDWPVGTPRAPRPELVKVWGEWWKHRRLNEWFEPRFRDTSDESFMEAALALGLATAEDGRRLGEFLGQGDAVLPGRARHALPLRRGPPVTRLGLVEKHMARARALESQARALLDEAQLLRATVDALTIVDRPEESPCPEPAHWYAGISDPTLEGSAKGPKTGKAANPKTRIRSL